MNKLITRTVALHTSSGRTSICLAEREWENLDRIASERGLKWVAWASDAVCKHPHLKKVAAIRKELQDVLSAERLDPLQPTDEAFGHEYVEQARFFDDCDLEEIRGHLREVWAVDCGGYIVRFGFNKLNPGNDPLLLLESRMKDGIHMTFAASNRSDE